MQTTSSLLDRLEFDWDEVKCVGKEDRIAMYAYLATSLQTLQGVPSLAIAKVRFSTQVPLVTLFDNSADLLGVQSCGQFESLGEILEPYSG